MADAPPASSVGGRDVRGDGPGAAPPAAIEERLAVLLERALREHAGETKK